MCVAEESRAWTEVRPSNRHESLSEVRERVTREGLQVFHRSAIAFGRKIGEGGQGTIYEARWQSDFYSKRLSVVVKKFKPLRGISQGHCRPQFWPLNLTYICKPYGVFFDLDDSLCMIMPRYSTDLRSLIDRRGHNEDGVPFSQEVAVSTITQLALGCKALHGVGIYHRDIKAANILVNSGLDSPEPGPVPEILIADFENSADVVGTGFWRAPEILQTLHMFSEDRAPLSDKQLQAADVYSFGMTCYEFLTGKTPFDGHRWSDYNLVLSGGRPELPDHVPEPLKNLIRTCWHQDPDSRPSFPDIVNLLKDSYLNAFYIVTFFDTITLLCEGYCLSWQDAPPEACLVRLKQTLLIQEALLPDILPPAATLQHLLAKFISTCEEFVSKFGWDSHVRYPSLPFVESVERRRLVNLMQRQLKLSVDGMHATGEEILDRVDGDGRYLPYCMQIPHTVYLIRRMWACILEGEPQSHFALEEESELDKFAIVQAFINSLLDAGVTKTATLMAVIIIANQLEMLEGHARYGDGSMCRWTWGCMILFHPFYDNLAKFLDTLFSYQTIWLYLGYKISSCGDLSFRSTGYLIPGFHEVLLAYCLALRVDGVFPFFTGSWFWKCCGWKGLLVWFSYHVGLLLGLVVLKNI